MTEFDPHLRDHLVSLDAWAEQTAAVMTRTSRASFLTDRIFQLALCKSIEQCGEICSRIIKRWPDFVDAHPEIEFRRAVSLRHRIAHAYEGLDLDMIWFTATISIPEMRDGIRALLSGQGEDDLP